MSFEARCPQCVFVSRQLGRPTPCLLHLSAAGDDAPEAEPEATAAVAALTCDDYDEPYTFGRLRPTADRPGPFSLREYTRLLLLRSRIHEERSTLDAPAQATRLVRR
jgi:hypothetical protein